MENGQRERSISRVGDDEQLEQVRSILSPSRSSRAET